MDDKRTWNNPTRKPWNPVIKHCLNAVDEHVRLHLLTGDNWHLERAQTLREYVAELKNWIHNIETRSGVK